MKKFYGAVLAAVTVSVMVSCSAGETTGQAENSSGDMVTESISGEVSSSAPEESDEGNGIMLNGIFVPPDTEKLFLTHDDMSMLEYRAGEFMPPEDCIIICEETTVRLDDVPGYDIKAIAEKLPDLRELYFRHAKVENTEYISEMKGLESLCYDAFVPGDEFYEAAVDTPFKDLPKLKDLWIFGDYADYTFLNDMPGLENVFVSIDMWRNSENCPYDSVFDCPVVTGFEIEIYNDLTGLEKLANLKHLHLVNSQGRSGNGKEPVDLSVLGELKELTCLNIVSRDYELKNISVIGELPRLENLDLSYVTTVDDWSFLPQLTSLKRLRVHDVKNIFSVIDEMTWLDEDNIIY
ncbi:MAG: hypothetical protein J1E40_02105 [Oscillospiraceae bacterium]|nr:hypothetical protein [Oscillospiraceae bacterium]